MRNAQVIDNFTNKGHTEGQNYTKNLIIEGDYLWNYSTVIAVRLGSVILLNNTRYSSTTSGNQGVIRRDTKGLLIEGSSSIIEKLETFNKCDHNMLDDLISTMRALGSLHLCIN